VSPPIQGGPKITGPEQWLHPLGAQGVGLCRVAGGADDTPALRDQTAGKGAGGIAVAKGKQR
jgi:hypothetical protein